MLGHPLSINYPIKYKNQVHVSNSFDFVFLMDEKIDPATVTPSRNRNKEHKRDAK